MAYLLLSLTILLVAIGQIAQKMAARGLIPKARLSASVARLLVSPAFWLSAACLGMALLTWLSTLSVMEVSKAYPLLGASFAVTALLSQWILKERVGRRRWCGILLVTAGAALMMTSQ